jgi:hypothetical protein
MTAKYASDSQASVLRRQSAVFSAYIPARAHELLRLLVQLGHEMAFCISNQTGMLHKNALERISEAVGSLAFSN